MTPLEIIIAMCSYLESHPDCLNEPVMIDHEGEFYFVNNETTVGSDRTLFLTLAEVRE